MTTFITVFIALFSIMNPLGTLPMFVALSKDYPNQQKFKTAIFTSINAVTILIVSFVIGKYLLQFFGISIDSLRIAGGLIIISSGFALLTGSFIKHKGMDKQPMKSDAFEQDNISLTPLAMPMLAGPGSISLIIGLQNTYYGFYDRIAIFLSIVCMGLVIFLMLSSSKLITKFFGENGMNAISRIIGLIVIAIGIEYVSTSVVNLISIVK